MKIEGDTMDWRIFERTYWRIYKRLEDDFFDTDSYCAIDTMNANAYSVRYLQQLLSIGGEIDVVCKALCNASGHTFQEKRPAINDWGKAIFEKFPNYKYEIVSVFEYEIDNVNPWIDLEIGIKSPKWWEVYNAVKHKRDIDKNWCKASQLMVFQALCALYVAIEYLVAVTFYKDDYVKENNDAIGHFRSERLLISKWLSYFRYFNVPAFYVQNNTIHKRLYEKLT